MFINKIVISNFKSFSKEVSMDLKPNVNNIEKSVSKEEFHVRDDFYLCPVIALGSTNSFGKTSLLSAVEVFFDYLHQNKKLLNRIKEESLIDFFHMTRETIDSDDINEMNTNKEFISWKRKLVLFNGDDENYEVPKEFTQINNKFESYAYTLFKQELFSNWYSWKREKEKTTYIILEFVLNNKSVNIKLEDELINNLWQPKISIEQKHNSGEYVVINDFYNNEILKAFKHYNAKNVVFYEHLLHNRKNVEFSLINIANFFGEEIALNLIQIADKNIIEINCAKDSNGVITNIKTIVNSDESVSYLKDVSTGTKKFINLFNEIFSAIKTSDNQSHLFLIDELDNNFHFSLADFFKRFIMSFAKTKDIQLIFTSHNPVVLSNFLSKKQVFLIEEKRGDKVISKMSSVVNTNISVTKQLLEQKIGSHPNINDINNTLGALGDFLNGK